MADFSDYVVWVNNIEDHETRQIAQELILKYRESNRPPFNVQVEYAKIKEKYQQGNYVIKIDLIKLYRAMTGCFLKEAKYKIDEYDLELRYPKITLPDYKWNWDGLDILFGMFD